MNHAEHVFTVIALLAYALYVLYTSLMTRGPLPIDAVCDTRPIIHAAQTDLNGLLHDKVE